MAKKHPPWLSLIGITPQGQTRLSKSALTSLTSAKVLIGSQRQLALIDNTLVRPEKREVWPSPLAPRLEELCRKKPPGTAILASGDPMCWGIGNTISDYLHPDEFEVFPQVSILTLIAARLKWPSHQIDSISLCSQPLSTLIKKLEPGKKLIILPAKPGDIKDVLSCLVNNNYGPSKLWQLENLESNEETITRTIVYEEAEKIAEINHTPGLISLALELRHDDKSKPLTTNPGLPDSTYNHDGQLTRQSIRAITLAELRPTAGALLWDIGLGNGSISVEWLRAAEQTRAIGIERDNDRLNRARSNAETLGVPQLEAHQGEAIEWLEMVTKKNPQDLPDAIFIGGGITSQGLLPLCMKALKPGGRLVANTVTLEGEAILISARAAHGGRLTKYRMELADTVGRFHGWRPQMPVTQWVYIQNDHREKNSVQ